MRSIRARTTFAGTFFFALALGAQGAPQVVGDEACEKYAVDIASFATCEEGRVVKPQPSNAGERRVEASKAAATRDAAPLAEARSAPNAAPNAAPRRQSR